MIIKKNLKTGSIKSSTYSDIQNTKNRNTTLQQLLFYLYLMLLQSK